MPSNIIEEVLTNAFFENDIMYNKLTGKVARANVIKLRANARIDAISEKCSCTWVYMEINNKKRISTINNRSEEVNVFRGITNIEIHRENKVLVI